MFKARNLLGKAALIALTTLMLTGCSGGSPEFFKLIKVTEAKGSVSVARKNETMDVYADMNMEAGDMMETGGDSYSRMVFDSTTHAIVEADSKLGFVADGKGRDAGLMVELEKGGIFTEFTEGMGAINSYSVKTPSAIAAVRGTVFYVREYEENGKSITRISVVEGNVAVTLLDGEGKATEETVDVPAGKEAIITNDGSAPVFEVKDQAIDFSSLPAELLDYVKVRIDEGTSEEMKYFFRDVYLEDAETLASEEKYEESFVDYDRIIEVMPEDTVMRESLSRTVEDYKDKLVEEKRFGTAEEVLDRYEEYADKIDYATVRADITDLKEKDAVVRSFMQTAYDAMMAEDYKAMVEIYDSEEINDIIETIKSMGDDRYIFFLDAEGERTGEAVGIYTYTSPDDDEKVWEDRYYIYAGSYENYRREGAGKTFTTIDGGGFTLEQGSCVDDAPDGVWNYYTEGSRTYMVDKGDYMYNKSSEGSVTYSHGISNGHQQSKTVRPDGVEIVYEADYADGVPTTDRSEEFANYYGTEWEYPFNDYAGFVDYYGDRYVNTFVYYYIHHDAGLNWWYHYKGDKEGFYEYNQYAPRDF